MSSISWETVETVHQTPLPAGYACKRDGLGHVAVPVEVGFGLRTKVSQAAPLRSGIRGAPFASAGHQSQLVGALGLMRRH
ncbi:hypothetical protein GCM10023097_10500 [Streptomyces collinus]